MHLNTTYPIVADGVRKFIRLQALPVPETQLKWTSDTSDLIEALLITKQCFAGTARMVDHQLYQTTKYSHTEDVKCELEEILLTGEDEHHNALLRKKNLTMYHLVLEPVIDAFVNVDHGSALAQSGSFIDTIIEMVNNFDDYGNEDDALVAKHQIRAMVKQREAARKEQKAEAKRNARKKKPVIEIPVEDPLDD